MAVADVNGKFLERQSIQTSQHPDAAIEIFSERVLRMITDHPELLFAGIGVALDHMAHEIGRGMRMVIAALAPEEIVFVGEFTRLWNHMGPIIERAVRDSALIGNPSLVRPAAAEPSVARLRGTVAIVLQEQFGSGIDGARESPSCYESEPFNRREWNICRFSRVEVASGAGQVISQKSEVVVRADEKRQRARIL